MNKVKNKYILSYILLMIIIGVFQLFDWYFNSEDPIWHIYFYILLIPILSFILGFLQSNIKKYYLLPLISFIMTCLVYIFMANGGPSIDSGVFIFSILAFIATIIGIIFGKLLHI